MGVLMEKRIADAHRLRTLWVGSFKEHPVLGEEKRLTFVTNEFLRRTPAGGFLYISSFSKPPSMNWMRHALRGKLGWDLHSPVIGDSLLEHMRTTNPHGGSRIWQSFHALEARVRSLEDSLGVTHE